jgi:hypothetical protein
MIDIDSLPWDGDLHDHKPMLMTITNGVLKVTKPYYHFQPAIG